MDIQPVRSGGVTAESTRATPPVGPPARISAVDLAGILAGDAGRDQGLLRELSEPDIAKLLEILERAEKTTEGIKITREQENPTKAIVTGSATDRTTQVARLDAEARLALAADVMRATHVKKLPDWDAEPQTLMKVGNRLLDMGGYANFVRATEVAQVVVDALRFVPSAVPTGEVPSRRYWRIGHKASRQPSVLTIGAPRTLGVLALLALALIVLVALLTR
jgi:hypothetical protein